LGPMSGFEADAIFESPLRRKVLGFKVRQDVF